MGPASQRSQDTQRPKGYDNPIMGDSTPDPHTRWVRRKRKGGARVR